MYFDILSPYTRKLLFINICKCCGIHTLAPQCIIPAEYWIVLGVDEVGEGEEDVAVPDSGKRGGLGHVP
jgi:hypothetical protein